jgi:glycosyltransferase involved in cell wall biosynthesis
VTAIHQFVPALLPRDATGDHTLALRDTLRAAGFESDIYVEAAHDDLWPQATYFEEYSGRARPDDLLVYQLSTASPVAEFLLGRSERLVLDYHNITPAHFYESWEDHTTAKVTLARDQVRALAPAAVLGIADSAFNAAELDALGCPSTTVIPILVTLGGDDGTGAAVDRRALDRLTVEHGAATVLLFVGRLSPNKGQHRLVEALWLYRRWYQPEARLHLVGPASTPEYARAVFELADSLGLGDAVRHGQDLSDGELAAWYADADVFVCLSEHEGFCIPLLEAMHAGLPVVALGAGAVPETLGDAGLLLHAARPGVVAAAVDRVAGDPVLAERLAEAGRRRLHAYDPEATRARFIEVLGALAARPPVRA